MYYVTAKQKGTSNRVTITIGLPKAKAASTAKKLRDQNKIAIPKYRMFSEIRVVKK